MIPEKAVEAAAKALRDKYALEVCDLPLASFLGDARAALEEAAPHILAPVWQEAYAQGIEDERTSAVDGTDYGPNRNNPYRNQV